MKKPKGKNKPTIKASTGHKPQISQHDLHLLEFHRQALALLPDPAEPRPGIAIISPGARPGIENRTCSCSRLSPANCAHVKKLDNLKAFCLQALSGLGLDADFRASIWHRLATVLGERSNENCQGISFGRAEDKAGANLLIFGSNGEELLSYHDDGPDASRLLERCLAKEDNEKEVPQRYAILNRLLFLTLSETEKQLLAMGSQSRRHALETTFWFRFCYHCYREFGGDGASLALAINEETGAFTVAGRNQEGRLRFRMIIPRQKVREMLAALRELLPNHNSLPIHPIPLKSIFRVSLTTKLDLDLRPQIELIQAEGESRFFERADLEKFRYGDLVYVRELKILAELERSDSQQQYRAPVHMQLKAHQIPGFIEEMDRDRSHYRLEGPARSLRIIRQAERVEIVPSAIDRDWCWFSLRYGLGDSSISLAEILAAREAGERYITTPAGWLDSQSEYFDQVARLLGPEAASGHTGDEQRLKLRLCELLRIKSLGQDAVEVHGSNQESELLNKLFNLQPPEPVPPIAGLTSNLRTYQQRGVEWLVFLYANGLGGLLCDDMGLGKTHQVMGFMLLLRGWKKISQPFLVVCPTTVLSHWQAKLQAHAPGLKTLIYHGGDRQLTENGQHPDVVLTSYGILWRDLLHLQEMGFALAVFDEMQHIKNPATRGYEAARELAAGMKLGLTGTPIENSLADLKALLDLTAPGYLGSDEDFSSRFVNELTPKQESSSRQELSRLIAPFTLRRRKQTVLDELPAKIEDIMTCSLSDQQVALYRQAIASRGGELLAMLADDQKPVPYMHIFALLTLLKQICNHPALVDGKPELYEEYQSGKFELFQELVSEALDSGQKLVVFSQYLGMIEIIERYLAAQGVAVVSLTGASRNRGELIARFNNDPDCRVFVGSLRAGGTGIDLVAGSVVIHYDRWWNAAREDQATDRVHRIGQVRGVQVFKLVTEGTLEEKIGAIIDRKRNLLDEVIVEDHPDHIKAFQRQELMELLSIRP